MISAKMTDLLAMMPAYSDEETLHGTLDLPAEDVKPRWAALRHPGSAVLAAVCLTGLAALAALVALAVTTIVVAVVPE